MPGYNIVQQMLYQPFALFLLFISNKMNKRIRDVSLKDVINLYKIEGGFNDDEDEDEDDYHNEKNELEQEEVNLNKIMKNQVFRHRGHFSGNDERFFSMYSMKIKRENEFNYLEQTYKMQILKHLQSPELSTNTKLEFIPKEELSVFNMFKGGLLDDWRMDIL